ncbi:hypothetical protein OKW21_005039 [Catalinimonas alkaloidigena]|uniref:BREX-1 system adenine-specific DNA-methyltransferase PglX n=1 Tax=Catalinimonas alkaloidigena TaxID=1075417 RepID=UPI0024070419|nr:BREX-1 system adenine-specific DNA-methyltransferase PglX [Catalinimonas alkaloidigena]MDF9799776.1 hypothetical protein [Catalinimonas alkaloidigena]
MAFDQSTRNRLQKFVSESRSILTEEFTRQLQATYGMDPKNGSIADIDTLKFLDNQGRETATILQETVAHYMASISGKSEKERTKQALERIVREQAFTVLNRLCALRMAEARGFLIESITKGYNSKGFQLYHRVAGTSLGETGTAYSQFLFSLFDEFSLDLAVLFDRHSSQGRLFPRETALLSLLEQINHYEIEQLWAEDETIGWIYQYFNSQEERKKMRAESQTPRNSRELAVRNQFFTPRYVVEFLTDNTLARIWYEMTQGKTGLMDTCRYLVRRPNEIFLIEDETAPEDDTEVNESLSQEELLKQPVYIPFRALKDPREIRMLDPACGSMHFGLYAFDLFEKIYEEAWQLETELGADAFKRPIAMESLQTSFTSFEVFQKAIPKLIIEHNIHGVDIDPRAVQIAGLSLWQRAQRAWHQLGIKPNERPTIKKSHIVCAEPMPGEKEMLREFTAKLDPPILGQFVEAIFEKMELAGEAGTLLKIEEEIATTISKAKEEFNKEILRQKQEQGYLPGMAPPRQARLFDFDDLTDDTGFWDTAEERILKALRDYADQAESGDGQKRLFAEDTVKGFAFIDLCQKRFDVIIMNPPFAEASMRTEKYIDQHYSKPSSRAVYAPFILRASNMLNYTGKVGALSARGAYFLSTYDSWRKNILKHNKVSYFIDLGFGVFEGPVVETAALVLTRNILSEETDTIFIKLLDITEREPILTSSINFNSKNRIFIKNTNDFKLIPTAPFAYWYPNDFFKFFKNWKSLKSQSFTACQGMSTTDDFRYLRLNQETTNDEDIGDFPVIAKGGEYATYYSNLDMRVNWTEDGKELRANKKSVLRNYRYYFNPGITWTEGTTSCFSARFLPPGSAISGSGQGIYCLIDDENQELIFGLLAYLNSRLAHAFIEAMVSSGDFSQAGGVVRHYTTDLIGRIPIPDNSSLKLLAKSGMKIFDIQRKISNLHSLEGWDLDKVLKDIVSSSLESLCQNNWKKIGFLAGEAICEVNKIDQLIADISAIDLPWLDTLSGPLLSCEKEGNNDTYILQALCLSDKELADQVFTQLPLRRIKKLGFYINRRLENIALLTGSSIAEISKHLHLDSNNPISRQNYSYILITELITGSNEKINCGVIGESDNNSCTISNIVKNRIANFEGDSEQLEKYLVEPFGCEFFSQIFKNVDKYFSFHFAKSSANRRYAPTLLPLQTPSDSYTLWVYYHRLTEQTLYTCVNDFVEPKLKTVTEELSNLRNKSPRSSAEEKELAKLIDLESELKDFRDELLRITKFWKPNLNDGVQITAAPLWKLFQHKQWQKKLKETWEKLEDGEYDWAHLACSIWPERVLRKCHQDRSFAIAHDVEDDFWEEVEVPIIRRGKDTGETKFEWQPKNLSENELRDLIQQKLVDLV